MKEPKDLAEWLESQGNPKHSIAEGENGSQVIVIDNLANSFNPGITVYRFKETVLPGGYKTFCLSSGWGLRKEYLPALKKFLNEEMDASEPESLIFEVWEWRDDETGEYENRVDIINAVSEYHARALLRDRISKGKYPKGSWLVYTLDGEKIELDTKGRITK